MTLAAAVARRLGQGILVVWGVTLVTFLVARVLPGNPVYLVVGSYADKATIAEATERLGLDKPIFEQYVIYLRDLVRGNLGDAITTSHSVTSDLGQRLPATVELTAVALFLIVLIVVPVGVAAALRPQGVVARVADALSAGGAAIPQFWLGLMLIYLFFFRLDWFPAPFGRLPNGDIGTDTGGFLLVRSFADGDFTLFADAAEALFLPALTLALTVQPPLLRLVQTTMQSALESDAVRTARAMGLPYRQVVYGDAFRLALLPIINMLALVIGILLSSSVLVETVFSWPGIGQYAVQAINASDYPAVQGVVLVSAIAYVLLYVLVDVAQVLVDPRVRSR